MQADGPQALGFTPREPRACCARATAARPCTWPRCEEMLDKAGLSYKRLQCGCHVPMFVELGVAPAPRAVRRAAPQLQRQAFGFPGDVRAPGLAGGKLSRARASAAAGDPARCGARGRPGARGDEDGRRRLLGAQLRDAAGEPGARLRATGQRGGGRGVRRELRATRRRDDGASRPGLGHPAQRPGLHARGARRLGHQGRCRRRAGRRQPQPRPGLRHQDRRRQQGRVCMPPRWRCWISWAGWTKRSAQELRPWRAETIASIKGAPVGERRPVFKLEARA